jgi:hypothetical protein
MRRLRFDRSRASSLVRKKAATILLMIAAEFWECPTDRRVGTAGSLTGLAALVLSLLANNLFIFADLHIPAFCDGICIAKSGNMLIAEGDIGELGWGLSECFDHNYA